MPFTFAADQTIEISGHQFEIDAFPDPTGSSVEAYKVAAVMWERAAELSAEIKSVRADRRYSAIGQAEQIEPIAKSTANNLLGSWHILADFQKRIDMSEQELIGIPKLDATHSAMHGEDREIREWFNRLTLKQQADQMEMMRGNGENERVALAILRSPIPVTDLVKASFKSSWEDSRRASNPLEAERIALGRQAIGWVEKNLMFATVAARSSTEWGADRFIRHGLTYLDGVFSPYLSKLGYAPQAIAHEKLRLKAEARQR